MNIKIRKSLIPVIIYCIFIFFLSSQQKLFWIQRAQEEAFGFRTSSFTYHIIEYAILGILLRIASTDNISLFLFSSFYGVPDEIHQYFVPFRVLSPYDMLANTIGGFIGIYFIGAWEGWIRKN